jgi:S1-C subfamily serine protease
MSESDAHSWRKPLASPELPIAAYGQKNPPALILKGLRRVSHELSPLKANTIAGHWVVLSSLKEEILVALNSTAEVRRDHSEATHMARRTTMRLLCLILLSANIVAAQSPQLTRKDIPTIAKSARGAIVTIVMANDDKPIARGTGFLVTSDGAIVTNYHVIATGNVAVVKFADGSILPVDGILATDKVRDLAIIKIHGKTFRPLTIGNSDQIQVGEEVVAIGNPLGLELTVSNGILSGVRTDEKNSGKLLQITAPISHGSSGGPLFNMVGEVIGINAMFLEGGENLNFAIPINDAKNLLGTKSATLRTLPNEQPGDIPTAKNSPDNDDQIDWQAWKDDLRKQLKGFEWIQVTDGQRNENSTDLRQTLQWMQDTLPEGSSECVTKAGCSRTELSKFVGCKVEFNLVLRTWIDGNRRLVDFPSLHYFDLGNIDPERISSKGVSDDAHRYDVFYLHTWNDTKKILQMDVPNNVPKNEADFLLKTDYSPRFEKAFRHAVDLCGGKPSTLQF